MNDIKEVYADNISLLTQTHQAVYFFRQQNYDRALRITSDIMNKLNFLIEYAVTNLSYFNQDYKLIDMDSITLILSGLLDAQKNKDYILLADLYELQIIPFIYSLQEVIMGREGFFNDKRIYEENLKLLEKTDSHLAKRIRQSSDVVHEKQKYHIEYTSSGAMTLSITEHGQTFYLHSNHNPYAEADILAGAWYHEEQVEYSIYGLGLGYHIRALLRQDPSIKIQIYESDIYVIKLAFTYCNLTDLLDNPNVNLYYDKDLNNLSHNLSKRGDTGTLLIHAPSLKNIVKKNTRERLENYFLQDSSIRNQIRLLNANFRSNIHNYNDVADNLLDKFQGKDLYIIAAGPSLDKNVHLLKEINRDHAIILATGTVFRKLINLGIHPDYVIVTDANPRVYAQIQGLEDVDVPMIFLSTAYQGFASAYKAKKYIVFQKDYDMSESYAGKKSYRLYQTGGSVSTTALDIGITLACRRIIFLGLDLAYPDNFLHAEGTSKRELTGTEGLRQVESVEGEMIYTSKSLSIYREWIEKRIQGIKSIEFIDATEGGARIRGMKLEKLENRLGEQ